MNIREPSSFRDRDAFVYYSDGAVYRWLNMSYKPHYEMFVGSGLYEELLGKGYLIEHHEVAAGEESRTAHMDGSSCSYKLLKPERLRFISYPYEWCFSQLKDAALLTLDIQLLSLVKGMSLKDASAYNVQFKGCRPVFIDSSSFEIYEDGKPWVAYGQFCRHFLVPLLLMKHKDMRLVHLTKSFIDGIPLDLAVKLLPKRSLLSPMTFMNIYMHSGYQSPEKVISSKASGSRLEKGRQIQLLEALHSFISKLQGNSFKSEWSGYANNNSYSEIAGLNKMSIVEEYLRRASPDFIWDIGSNAGKYGIMASKLGMDVLAVDSDIEAVEKCYLSCESSGNERVLPLCADMVNPSPGTGWENMERKTLWARGKPDLVMALALLHHLIICEKITMDMAADFFSRLGRYLIIEFAPVSDKMVSLMLGSKNGEYAEYSIANFEKIFCRYFTIIDSRKIADSERSIYIN